MSMFCYQCEQSAKGVGCSARGVCGKDPQTAVLQDLLISQVKQISKYAHRATKLGSDDRVADRFVMEGLFTTVTNVNFDPTRLFNILTESEKVLKHAAKVYAEACHKKGVKAEVIEQAPTGPLSHDIAGMCRQGETVGIKARQAALGEDRAGLQELLLYGLKGVAAYADHAYILGLEDVHIYAFIHEALDFLTDPNPSVDDLVAKCLACGEINLKVMALLDAANTGEYGNPVPTAVRVTPVKGKAILVSGHDLKDLANLLKQTEGKGINIYTHGEMLPAHGYPGLKKYKHLVGNYGGAWQNQRAEFAAFPGAILMTTNCIQEPKDSYKTRIFTAGLVAFPGVEHIENGNFSPVIASALAADGFKNDEPEKTILVGFAHDAVLKVAGTVIDAVKSGAIKHFFLIGGCDGAKPGRNYYTDFATLVPKDCVILTLACGKYRFNHLDFGSIGGIPRLLDCGQCNDAYSAIQIAVALAGAFKCGVNDLPLSLVLSWYEQKAVCILLTLLHLGIKNIRLGPSLPAFVTPAVLKVLVDNFNIAPITTPQEDLAKILGKGK